MGSLAVPGRNGNKIQNPVRMLSRRGFSQVSYKGITSAFQADDASSSLATRSKIYKPPTGGFFVP